MRTLAWLIATPFLVYAAVCLALFLFQRSLLYFPQTAPVAGPLMKLVVPGAELNVSVRPHAGPKALIYFGGNAEDVSQSLAALAGAFPDRALYLAHYRGFGGSSGKPAEAELRRDALALFDRVHTEHSEIAVIGRSLGSGVAIGLATQRPVARLALVTPYASIEEIAAAQYPWAPVRWLIKDRFDSTAYAGAVQAPSLLIAAEFDEMIPGDSTRRLFEKFAPGRAMLQVIPQTAHNTILLSPHYLEALRTAL